MFEPTLYSFIDFVFTLLLSAASQFLISGLSHVMFPLVCNNNCCVSSTEIGMGLTGFGVFFLFFGMMLFFDKALLAIGNILFVSGLSFVIGLERTFRFFFQRHKVKATSFFLGGVLVVLIGWPIIGVVLEIYGFFLLFRGFFPVAIGFIRRVPVLGSLLSLPGISTVSISCRSVNGRLNNPSDYWRNLRWIIHHKRLFSFTVKGLFDYRIIVFYYIYYIYNV
uniref:Golgi transport 1Bb n=1 Tax=Dicentrarchus labrax TaxID=13489 RepID=A0A8P4GN14_DICLA